MAKLQVHLRAVVLGTVSIAGAVLTWSGCSTDPSPDTDTQSQAATNAEEGGSTPIKELPFVEAAGNQNVLAELLPRPTSLGETTALHVKLPPPHNPELRDSLIRVVGSPDSPQVLFRSDSLAQLGVIKKSPGRDFFTAFSTLPPEQLDSLVKERDQIASGRFGDTTSESVLFAGRAAIGRTINPTIDPAVFRPGISIPLPGCPIRPISTAAAWGKSLFITDPQVVQDPARTWDPCTGAGTPGGVWTFAHLIREMANGSGRTPEQFALEWLSNWLNSYVVNGDTVPARVQMFAQVIQPWANASGVTAMLLVNPFTGKRFVSLSGPLDLDIAPFRLLAIVNRIDLGETATGGGGYGGSSTSVPVTAGELRFIFGVVQPNPWGGGSEATCGRKLFTTIFEYGVPRNGCTSVVDWARQWTTLQSFAGFNPAYLAQLQGMTESVVLHGAAPAKGNQNAINQIRTNEIALAGPWELREFTLTAENPPANADPPASGPLRTHTVAMTPNDSVFSAAGGDPTINAFINGPVTAGVPLPVTFPNRCSSSYSVPFSFGGAPFRGGNTFVPPGHWNANSITPASPVQNICARHVFSLNTCGGCHRDDSGTNGLGGSTSFTHVDPLSSIPVRLSKFLTGGGPGLLFNVPDTQFGVIPAPGPPAPIGLPAWQFADLERRFQRLFDIAHCTSCLRIFTLKPDFVSIFERVPVDIDPGDPPPFEIGPVVDLGVVKQVLESRTQFAGAPIEQPPGFIRANDFSAH